MNTPLAFLFLCGASVVVTSAAAGAQTSAQPARHFAAIGGHPGAAGLLVHDLGPTPQLWMSSGLRARSPQQQYWSRLEPDPAGGLRHAYVSPQQSLRVRRMAVGKVGAAGAPRLVVLNEYPSCSVQDPMSGAVLATATLIGRLPQGLALADLDADGRDEILVIGGAAWDPLEVYDGDGALLWTAPNLGANDLAVGQFDADPALEAVTSAGVVFDLATRSVEWTAPAAFGLEIEAVDVDGDGVSELLAMPASGALALHSIAMRNVVWALPSSENDAIAVVDLESDGIPEVLHGLADAGGIVARDARDGSERFRLVNPNQGVAGLAACDLDRDGRREIVWGSRRTTVGGDAVYVADGRTHALAWTSPSLTGPFLDPLFGDLDGDQLAELVSASSMSDDTRQAGQLLVWRAPDYEELIMSPPISGPNEGPLEDLELFDYDLDGELEILVATVRSGNGVAQAWGLRAGALTLEWENLTRADTSAFTAIVAGDVDGDGDVEILVSTRSGFLGSSLRIVAYDAVSGVEEWRSADLGAGVSTAELRLFDLDGDARPEICLQIHFGALIALDGVTRQIEFQDGNHFLAMERVTTPAGEALLLSDSQGVVHAYAPWRGSPRKWGQRSLYYDSISGLAEAAPGLLWIQARARARLVDWNSGALLWESPSYYESGRKVASLPGSRRWFALAGSYGVIGFRVD